MVRSFKELVDLIGEGVAIENISFGSGGYCVVLRDEKRDQAVYAGYAWDLEDAFAVAEEKLRDARSGFRDEDTSPG